MSQRTAGAYALTQIPGVYALAQAMLGSARAGRILLADYLKPQPSMRVLDVGCGSASLLPALGAVDYVGIDLNPRHVEEAKRRHGAAGAFHCCDLKRVGEVAPGRFDLIMCVGVLHHIDDAALDGLVADMSKRLSDGGRAVTVDPAFVPGQHPVARLLAKLDAGRSVRAPEGYSAPFRARFESVETVIRHDLLHVPYTHCIVVAAQPH
jgi:SAM-dependent methyltransferase